MKWKNIIIITAIMLVLGLCFSCVLLTYSDTYNRIVFEKEIRKDEQLKKLLYCDHVPYFLADNVYEIVIKLKDGKIIGGDVRFSIYRFQRLTIIDNYRISFLYLDNDGVNGNFNEDGIYYSHSISSYMLEKILQKPKGYFKSDLNLYIKYYDEIKDFFDKIYYEERIPGSEEDKGPDISKWGDEEKLKKYTGYILINETDRVKVYVDYIGNKYAHRRPREFH
jgi:hypothetical protein